jgi:hypothetical protein
MATEKRRYQRIEVNEPGSISWQTEEGATMSDKIVMLNLAENGAMIEMTRKLPYRQAVLVKVPAWEIDSSATVRYVRQRGLKYRVGLELFHTINEKPNRNRWT